MTLFISILTLLLAPVLGFQTAVFLGYAPGIVELFFAGDLLLVLIIAMASYGVASFVLAFLTGDCSQTDRLWSTAPVVYAGIILARDPGDLRMILMALLVFLWGLRLTANFARRGGYTSIEDYRWEALRKKIPNPLVWQLFNLTFIAGYQHILILAFVLPMWHLQGLETQPGVLEYLVLGFFLLSLGAETISDEQQWQFQEQKRRALAEGKLPPDGNFRTSGLWRYSRHPNTFFEALNWWAFYLFIPAASGEWFHWTIAGTALLTLLLQGSIAFTEGLSVAKYPEYRDHQKRVSRFVPWFRA